MKKLVSLMAKIARRMLVRIVRVIFETTTMIASMIKIISPKLIVLTTQIRFRTQKKILKTKILKHSLLT